MVVTDRGTRSRPTDLRRTGIEVRAWRRGRGSHDRHPDRQPEPSTGPSTLAGRLERGAVQRAESVISQAGGKGVNISRAAVAAGIPTIAVLPPAADDPFVLELLAAGIDCRPVPPRGRPPGQPHHHRARRHHHQAQQPRRRQATCRPARPSWHGGPGAPGHRRRWVVLAGSLPPGAPPTGTPSWSPTCAPPAPGSRSTPATHRCRRWSTRSRAARPHLIKPNGEELASFTGGDADALEADPIAAAGRPPTWWAGASSRCWPPWAATARSWSRRGRLARHSPADHGRQHRRGRRLQPVRLPAGDVAGRDPARQTRTGRGLRQRGRRTARHHHPPARTQVRTGPRRTSPASISTPRRR